MLTPAVVPLLLLLLGSGPLVKGQELRVGMDTRSPPWAFVPGLDYSKEDLLLPPSVTEAQLATLQGFDVEVMRALGRRLEMTPRVVPVSWFRIEQGLLEGRYDVILSSWTPTARTPGEIVASVSYCDWGLVLAVRADEAAIHSYADLEGRRVGHMRDPAVKAALHEMGQGRFVQNEDPEKLFADLKKGALDAVIMDSFYVRFKVSRDPSLRVIGEPLNRLGYHVGVRKESPALLARVDQALKALLASGEVGSLRRKWEGAAPAPEGQ